jgi:hypothetical protein
MLLVDKNTLISFLPELIKKNDRVEIKIGNFYEKLSHLKIIQENHSIINGRVYDYLIKILDLCSILCEK